MQIESENVSKLEVERLRKKEDKERKKGRRKEKENELGRVVE